MLSRTTQKCHYLPTCNYKNGNCTWFDQIHGILTMTPGVEFLHFVDKEAEAQGGAVICWSCRWKGQPSPGPGPTSLSLLWTLNSHQYRW